MVDTGLSHMVTRYLSCGSLSISGLTAPLLSRYSKSYFGSSYTALFMQLCPSLLAANSSVFALEQTTPSSLLPPMQLFVLRPDPLHLTRPLQKLQKVIFFFGLFLDRSKKMKQQSGCPISYSSLTTCRQQEQFLPRVPALDAKKSTTVPENMLCCKKKQQLPFVKKLGYTGICEAMCQQQEKHTYLYLYILHCFSIYRCLKDTAFADYIHAKFSFDRLYPNLSSLASNYLLPTSFLYCFYSYSSSYILPQPEEPTCLFSV